MINLETTLFVYLISKERLLLSSHYLYSGNSVEMSDVTLSHDKSYKAINLALLSYIICVIDFLLSFRDSRT